jgi:hypothetical protein
MKGRVLKGSEFTDQLCNHKLVKKVLHKEVNQSLNGQTVFSPQKLFFSFWPVMNPAELANGPALCVRRQEQGMCFVWSANRLSIPLYKRLATSLVVRSFTGQKLTNALSIFTLKMLFAAAGTWEELQNPYLIVYGSKAWLFGLRRVHK